MKKRYFSFAAKADLVGGTELASEDAKKVAAVIRQDIREFGLSVAEIADLCQTNHIFPHDLLPSKRALAEQVLNELLRRHEKKPVLTNAFAKNSPLVNSRR